MKSFFIVLLLLVSTKVGANTPYWVFQLHDGDSISIRADALPYFTIRNGDNGPTCNLYIVTTTDTEVCAFEDVDYMKLIYKEDTPTGLGVICGMKEVSNRIYTVEGKDVTGSSLLPNVLYIQNGRKFVIK